MQFERELWRAQDAVSSTGSENEFVISSTASLDEVLPTQ